MRVGYADHAGVAGRRGYARYAGALRREGGRDTQTQSQEGKGKTDALTLLSQAYFSECCQGQALRARKRDLDRDRIPAFSKAGIQAIPLPATAATPLSPDGHRRRCESAMPTTQASPAVGGRPATQARCDEEEGGTSHQTQSQEGKGKTAPLPSYH